VGADNGVGAEELKGSDNEEGVVNRHTENFYEVGMLNNNILSSCKVISISIDSHFTNKITNCLAISSISSRKDSFLLIRKCISSRKFLRRSYIQYTRLSFPFSFTLGRNWFGCVTVFNCFQLFHETCLK
jgi:hypothetical protein